MPEFTKNTMDTRPSGKLLYICLHNPFETDSGGQQRSRHLFLALQKHAHIDLVCFTKEPQRVPMKGEGFTVKHLGPIPEKRVTRSSVIARKLKVWSPVSAYQVNAFAEALVDQLLKQNQYTHVVVRYLEAVFLSGLYYKKDLIIDADDLPWERLKTYRRDKNLTWKTRLFYAYDHLVSKIHLKSCMKKASHIFVANKNHKPTANCLHLPNVPMFPEKMDVAAHHEHTEQSIVLFVGTLDYKPNLWGVDYFVQNIWSSVIANHPEARFWVVGKGLTPEMANRWQQSKGVQIMGFAPDLYRVYQQSTVVVAPIYHGSGTNIKVMEAMAYGKACVTTGFAARGLDHLAIHNKTILLAENDHCFAQSVLALLNKPDLVANLGREASRTVRDHCSVELFNKAVDVAFSGKNSAELLARSAKFPVVAQVLI